MESIPSTKKLRVVSIMVNLIFLYINWKSSDTEKIQLP